MKNKNPFSFEISLSVLNHLGRNLYRSFATVLGEAISNSWDADATNVHIYIDKKNNSMFIKDDGIGMTADDFQNKFLKIGYSKRRINNKFSQKKRPFIGRKGIGKLALLSCADKITVISKVKGGAYVGGKIDNSGLDKAITDDLTPKEYPLGSWDLKTFKKHTKDHKHGTIIYFENIKDGIKSSLSFLRKMIALYFRFALLDKNFKIHTNDQLITLDCLDDLALKTEFLWELNDIKDPYLENLKNLQSLSRKGGKQLKEKAKIKLSKPVKGFIASVEKPSHLNIFSTGEKVSIDLFVNGRLRERDILKHKSTTRVVESYLYGQIHFDGLDDKIDRFASSREGIVADDPKFDELLNVLKNKIIPRILNDWDNWRRKNKEDGDSENPNLTAKERKAEELYNAVSNEYVLPKNSKNKKKVQEWVDNLGDDARFNFSSYAECFISENLIRRYIQEKKIALSKEAKDEVEQWQKRETDSKNKGNISINLRQNNNKLSYLSMDGLANLVDKPKDRTKEAGLSRDANEYKPIRDALAHTALLTDKAKQKLTTVYSNIQARILTLLSKK